MFPAPDFVESLADGEYVYFFFREQAVEYINCGKVGVLSIYQWIANTFKASLPDLIPDIPPHRHGCAIVCASFRNTHIASFC